MIIHKKGISIFHTDAKILVNPVNCVGVMGAGLALSFKGKYSRNYIDYNLYCESGQMKVGKVFITHEEDVTIINFPTKDHWRGSSKLEWIESGLIDMLTHLKKGDIVALPLLGCGLGGLSEVKVMDLYYKYLDKMEDITFYICYSKNTNTLAKYL